MSQATRFSIVIPHRNGAELLLGAVDALKSAWDPNCDEVIVIDNASTDDSVPRLLAAHPEVAVIRNDCNNGFGRACNQGLRQAKGEFALILNNDARLQPGSLDAFAEFFREHGDVALIGPQLMGAAGEMQRSFGWHPDFVSETGLGRRRRPPSLPPQEPFEVETLVGASLAVRLAAVAEAGGFDEDFFFYFEETEWCRRMSRHGWTIWLLPQVKVIHGKGESTRPLRNNAQIEMLRSRLLYYRKAFPLHQAVFLTVWRVARLFLNVCASLLAVGLTFGLFGGSRRKAATYLRQLAWLLLGCPESWGLPDKCPRQPAAQP